jgi:hypothetical protein
MNNFIVLNVSDLNKVNGGCYWRGANIPGPMPVFPYTFRILK